MRLKSEIRALIFGPLAVFAASLLFVPAAAAQDNTGIPGDPSFANTATWRAPSANLFVSVRESNGLPVGTNAIV